jgi:hypothetical protein
MAVAARRRLSLAFSLLPYEGLGTRQKNVSLVDLVLSHSAYGVNAWLYHRSVGHFFWKNQREMERCE